MKKLIAALSLLTTLITPSVSQATNVQLELYEARIMLACPDLIQHAVATESGVTIWFEPGQKTTALACMYKVDPHGYPVNTDGYTEATTVFQVGSKIILK
ncbi:MAG: hypothetical protein ACI92I_000523 [Acidimicrobiales bacterium]|jgi:hypothetical protein